MLNRLEIFPSQSAISIIGCMQADGFRDLVRTAQAGDPKAVNVESHMGISALWRLDDDAPHTIPSRQPHSLLLPRQRF
jgi:hypothetical protein